MAQPNPDQPGANLEEDPGTPPVDPETGTVSPPATAGKLRRLLGATIAAITLLLPHSADAKPKKPKPAATQPAPIKSDKAGVLGILETHDGYGSGLGSSGSGGALGGLGHASETIGLGNLGTIGRGGDSGGYGRGAGGLDSPHAGNRQPIDLPPSRSPYAEVQSRVVEPRLSAAQRTKIPGLKAKLAKYIYDGWRYAGDSNNMSVDYNQAGVMRVTVTIHVDTNNKHLTLSCSNGAPVTEYMAYTVLTQAASVISPSEPAGKGKK